MSFRTPLSNVKGLGTANEGSEHFWRQRVTGFANLLLSIFVIYAAYQLSGASYSMVKAFFQNPLHLVLAAAFIISTSYHMRLGMQVVIEDYVHNEGSKILLLILNSFFAGFIALAGLFSLLKLGLGA
ncbi:MAG: succinate dehydrogenase, hydrophobic membrane anchor protein [Rhodomicrobium sp.]|nr:MAG: succinate dehydrogenase, hydrophobic membrane anchor protein [Rhodomicrobium sp.]